MLRDLKWKSGTPFLLYSLKKPFSQYEDPLMFSLRNFFKFVMGIDPKEKSLLIHLPEDGMGGHLHPKRGGGKMLDVHQGSETHLTRTEKLLDRIDGRCL